MSERRPKVLILDDDDLIRELLQEVCRRRGYEAVAFANPALCPVHTGVQCSCSPEGCVEVIFCDLQMPMVNGLDFIESMLSKGCRCRHIALVSGSCESEDMSRAVRLGCKVIPKPFQIRQIEDFLEEAEQSFAG